MLQESKFKETAKVSLLTPYLYYGGQLLSGVDRSFYTLDWLELTLKVSSDHLQDHRINRSNLYFEEQSFGNKNYSRQFKIYYKSKNVATLFTSPRSSVLNSDFAHVKFENSTLYAVTNVSWYTVLKELLECLNAKVISITRLDLAKDINLKEDALLTEIVDKELTRKHARFSANIKSITKYANVIESEFRTTQLSIGSRSSSMMMKMYCKTLELKESKKDYITAIHKHVFKNQELNVNRIEITFRSKKMLEIMRVNEFESVFDLLKCMNDADFLSDLFESTIENYYDLRDVKENKVYAKSTSLNYTGAKEFSRIDIKLDVKKKVSYDQDATKIRQDTAVCKVMIQRLAAGDQQISTYNTLKNMMQNDTVVDFVIRRYVYWLGETVKTNLEFSKEFIATILSQILDEIKTLDDQFL